MQIVEIVKMAAGSTGGAFAMVLSGILFLAWLYAKFIRLCCRIEHLEAEAAGTEKRAQSIGERLDGRIETLRNDIHEIKGGLQYVKSMMNSLVNANQSNVAALVQAHSPLSLTDVGREAAAEMSAAEAVASNWDRVRAILDAEVPSRNPYDIQTFCLEQIPVAPERFFGKDVLDAFKVYAFNHGRTLFDCLKVVGVMVRDKCLVDRGIPLASLDGPQ